MKRFFLLASFLFLYGISKASVGDSLSGDSCTIYIPNAISQNDETSHGPYWMFSSCPLQDFVFTVYDRWGEKVFTGKTLGRDGYLLADLSKFGNEVYVYTLSYKKKIRGKDVEKKFSGHITVLK